VLAKVVYEATKNLNWAEIKGIILLNHGIFTFDNDGMVSYEKMIDGVKIASDYLAKNTQLSFVQGSREHDIDVIKQIISQMRGYDVVCIVNTSPLAQTFACRDDLELSQQGVLTPEHIIRTKRKPVILDHDYLGEIENYRSEYKGYFDRHQKGEIILDTTPNWGILKGYGTISFGKNEKEAMIIRDINDHTMEAMMRAAQLGGYVSINEANSFAMEYWELEQAKLKK
jgi:rhamnose utilization protein RhaD (predicted bifunctional aldolase and dehydrogenase)